MGTINDMSSDPTRELIADVFDRNCPSRRTMEIVMSKWGSLAMVALREGTFRFNALRRRVDGVSEKMLSQTLHALERDGLVLREAQSTIPPHVEYSLTPLGARVADQMFGLIEILEGDFSEVMSARARYDGEHPAA